ncbi:MAG: hypothetical protein WEB63_09120 [Cucumibacter sp.]
MIRKPIRRRTFLAAAAAAVVLPAIPARAIEGVRLGDLYNDDLTFSPYALFLAELVITVEGFMAPPLKAESKFFVLTGVPTAVCPFCDSEAAWPGDIASVYTSDVISVIPFTYPIRATGTLRLGTYRDEELGFVSRLRLTESFYGYGNG